MFQNVKILIYAFYLLSKNVKIDFKILTPTQILIYKFDKNFRNKIKLQFKAYFTNNNI